MRSIPWLLSFVLLLAACKKEDPVAPAQVDTTPAVVDNTYEHLLMGNPSGAVTSTTAPDNYLMRKAQYALAYNNSRGTAAWVSWHLAPEWLGNAPRCDCFTPDAALPLGFFRALSTDYSGSGFDRGHMCPSGDRTANDPDNAVTFLMTNILPQAPQLNQGPWAVLEDYARSLVDQGEELYIISGGYGSGGTGSNGGTTHTLANGTITVPARYWKVLLILPNGEDDLERVTTDTRVIAVDMPNTQSAVAQPWGYYRVSVDDLEGYTGLDLFSVLPTEVQEALESAVDNGPTQ